MRRFAGPWALAVAVLSACQLTAPVADLPDPRVSTRPKTTAKASASPTPTPATSASVSAAPSSGPSASPSASTAPAVPSYSKLQRPSGAALVLSGQVRIDAHYLSASRSGSIISHNGSGLGVAGGATLIGNNGGNLISNNGGAIVAAGAGNVISNGGGQYRVLAEGETLEVAVGAILPVAGLEIRATDIAAGKPLSLGVDGAGKPVYAVYTNAEGAFEVYLPEGTPGANVLLSAIPPQGTDPRLIYERYVNQKVADAAIDEDTALITSYIREAFARQLDVLFVGKEGQSSSVTYLVPPELEAVMKAIEDRFIAAAETINAREMPRVKRLVVARRAADAMLAFVDLEAITFENSTDRVLPGITQALKDVRERSATKLAADPAFFTKQDYMTEANAARPEGEAPYEVLKPTDVGDFVNRWVMGTVDNTRRGKLDRVVASIGAPATYSDMLIQADLAITTTSSLKLVTEPKSVEAVEKAIQAGAP